ncbi:hypothetical protein TVAG_115660 [Trichomonas vaginalis G3]|uniref:VPS9 domain-containing protein n=1 Tax=Trichomonas vaginalis (strain ATCC PRA-98 / G3) TaxID=412133 RepID=A2EH39_TRIV3|nr:VPS9 domain family [Trichomonas vaginalis G3]EAY08007.1 hypothetical protein TVAG_115660 [Trichomonas vaginalis G3]KAI5537373.1 VPS9 domain family [Trichomonas vaginalis G3]|eukprot:XP_001320230.1 hypothetical protein [Trichomonas vaginalis G3]
MNCPIEIPSISAWIERNKRISPNVKFDVTDGDTKKIQSYKANKERYLTTLMNCKKNLEMMKNQAIKTISEVHDAPFMKLGHLSFNDQTQNTEMHKLVFLHRKIQSITLKSSNETLNNLIEKIEDCEKLKELLLDQKIPENIVIKIDETFFMYSISMKLQKLTFRITALQNYYSKLEEKTKLFSPPKWFTDFPGFMHQALSSAVSHLDKTLSYIPPQSWELPLSRYCFSGISDYGQKIDEICKTILTMPPPDFLKSVLELGLTLIPDQESFSTPELSVGLLLYFRVIFDRLYELYPDILFVKKENEAVKMAQLSNLPCELYLLPEKSSPDHISTQPIREAFRNDYYYRSATQFLESSMFCTNPIDDLYAIHKTLLCINKAALMQRMKEKVASINDINELLCFDDLFVLFLGCYLSSDLYEFMSIADFVARFSPAFCLSNSFEYAQATLESLVTHINSITPDILRERLVKIRNSQNQ